MKKSRREFVLSVSAAVTGIAGGARLLAQDSLLVSATLDLGNAAAKPRMRGVMIDAARLPETLDSYRRMIAFFAAWQFNTIHLRLADDQGSALRFASAPQLVTHAHAFSPDELHELVRYAQSHGIEIIPEIESFGHTGFITRSPAYAHLLDNETRDAEEFDGIIPVHPETIELFGKLYGEIADIFPSTYLHGGCDEVNWGGSALSRKALQTKTRTQIWVDYLNSLHRLSRDHGKQLIVWGDFVIHKQPEILTQLDKSIVLMDWNYSETDGLRIKATLEKIRGNGFRAIGGPALINYQWGARAGSHQLRNIDAFAETYFEVGDTTSLGAILTNWVPMRYIQNSIRDGFAYASIAFSESAAAARATGFRRFVERHYGAAGSEIWDEIFQIVYDYAPSVEKFDKASNINPRLSVPWSSDGELSELLHRGKAPANPFTRLRALLARVSSLVRVNQSDFQAFQLCAEYLERLFARDAEAIDRGKNSGDRESAGALIQAIAARDSALLDALNRDWVSGRFPNDEALVEPVFALAPKDQLLLQWRRATAYSQSLARDPARFYQLLQTPGSK